MTDTIEKLKKTASEAKRLYFEYNYKTENKNDGSELIKFNKLMHANKVFKITFNPQTVLTLLELLELYKHSRFMSYGESTFIEKEAALLAKVEEGVK